MRKFIGSVLVGMMLLMTSFVTVVNAQQIPNSDFEDWSGAAFDGNPQPKYWNASNVEQVGFKFNFGHKEEGHNGGYCLMVQDQKVGAMGITETSPGYFSLGHSWVYLEGINSSTACAGTHGGYAWTYRPDTMSVWIRRTGNNTDKEDFYLLYYAWTGQTRADKYPNKGGGCTSVTQYDEESDIRQALDANGCGTVVKGTQIAEGMWREKQYYGEWTNIKVPIYYFNDDAPEKVNLLFSASNYPNGSSSAGLYEGNSLYVDDIELIYSAKIQKLLINGIEWKGFDPNSTAVQTYALGESAPYPSSIVAKRGAGTITNAAGVTAPFPGRTLKGSEIKFEKDADWEHVPTKITVKSEDGKKTMVYQIQFQRAASSNAKLASISYTVGGETTPIADFSPTKYNYTVDLPYGTTQAPRLSVETQEAGQDTTITQPTSVTGTGKIVVTAPNGSASSTYTVTFRVAALSDNTLKDIKVNGNSIPGFNPSQAVYKVSLPTSTSKLTVEPVSAYPGEQTIVITPNPLPTGEAINGSTVQIAVSTPGNTVPKNYKLNIKLEASSYSYLKDLKVEGYDIQFASEQTTYYVNLPVGTTKLPAIYYERGDEYQTVEISKLADGVVDGTVRVTVTAGNGSDQTVYKIVFSAEKSTNSKLKGIKIDGKEIEGFHQDTLNYTVPLPIGYDTVPDIKPIPGDDYQTITVTKGTLNSKTRISVTAGNGSTTIYQLSFVVATYTDNTLKDLKVEGYEIDFDPQVNEYSVNLKKGTTELPKVTPVLQDEEQQTLTVRAPSGLTGDYKITVRPSGGASRTYVIHFSLDKSTNTALAAILLDGKPLPDFHPDTLHYVDSLPEGESRIPNVTFTKAENSQRVLSVLEGTTQKITVTAESGDKRIYTIEFVIRASTNAFLKMIYLDDKPLQDFDSATFQYYMPLTADTCPRIRVDSEEGQQITLTTPYGAGDAIIRVQPGAGAANTYTITFTAQAVETVRLSDILINGVSIEGFDPTKFNYEATYSGSLPTIEGVAAAEGQTVSPASWKNDTAYIYVVDQESNKATYSVAFTRTTKTISTLEAIYANGVLLAGFHADTLHYAYELEAGSAYPEVSYKASDATQIVFFGQVSEGKWAIHVAAENGTTTEYTVAYTIAKYTDSSLLNLEVAGHTLAFDPATKAYNIELDEGEELPALTPTLRLAQTAMTYAVNANEQRVVVTAESGDSTTYTVHYNRKLSANALLRDILIDGKSLPDFRPDSFAYSVTLPTGTKVIPNVFAVAQLNNQTITTELSRPNDTTRIHVVAQDGKKEKVYKIAFPVTLSSNTKLGSLMIAGKARGVDTTEYVFELPYGTTQPYDVSFTKAEGTQLIDYQLGGLDDVTRITVKAENGDSRTYTVRYKVAEPEGDNVIVSVKCEWVTANDKTNSKTIQLKGDTVIDLPYGAKSFNVLKADIVKSYPEQSVIFYNGGIRRGATIIVSANRAGEADKTYKITPRLPEYGKAGKLQTITFNGMEIENFRPDVFNYVIKVPGNGTVAKAQFTATVFTGTGTTCSQSDVDEKKKQILFTTKVGGVATNVYSVCWYYEDDEKPFTFEWIQTDTAHFYNADLFGNVSDKGEKAPTGYKPKGWSVPADLFAGIDYDPVVSHFVYYTGKEVNRIGSKEVLLSTVRGGALNSSIPGAMTLGSLSIPSGVNIGGGTKVSFDKNVNNGATFRNTPESFAFDYQPIITYDINSWNAWIALGDGNTNTVEYTLSGDYNDLGIWKTAIQDLNYDFKVQKMNILLCSSAFSGSSLDIYGGSDAKSCDLQIRDVRFLYNSELDSAYVNGKAATLEGRTFKATVADDYIGIPLLQFKGAVPDQMQVIEWLNDGEWVNGELKARVINYGENLKDSTHYFVVVKRNPEKSKEYTIDFGTDYLDKQQVGDTVFVTLKYGTKALPNIEIIPNSIHQRFAIEKNGMDVKVTVSAESGKDSTAVYAFRAQLSDVTTVEGIYAEDFNLKDVALSLVDDTSDTTRYTFFASMMPYIRYERPDGVYGQKIAATFTDSRATLLVTAATGDATHTYIFDRLEPVVKTNAQLKDFRVGDSDIPSFGLDKTDVEMARPTECVFFNRVYESDSVVFVQSETKMQWFVFGDTVVTYTLTYPTVPSDKKQLKTVRLNGEKYTEFDPNINEYTLVNDSILALSLEPAETLQQLNTTCTQSHDTIVYTTVVTAQNLEQATYTFIVHAPRSNDATLAGILVDSVRVAGFHPDTLNYTVIIPSPKAKQIEPQMPSITYEAGEKSQVITLTPAWEIGEMIDIDVVSRLGVQSQTGARRTYHLTVKAEPSSCTDLSGIMVNGVLVDDFEPGNHHYSVMVKDTKIDVEYTSDDRFQNVQIKKDSIDAYHYRYSLTVTAQSGAVGEKPYVVDVYIEKKSSDATLANILLDGKEMIDFEPEINGKLAFDPGNNLYNINMPSGPHTLPQVSAKLKMEGQSVDIYQTAEKVELKVTAANDSVNTYHLNFNWPKSTNANLAMIYLDGDSLKGFDPKERFYEINLPVGKHELPVVEEQKAESAQETSIVTDSLRTTIEVIAEDKMTHNTYTLLFHPTLSDADTLLAILEDEVEPLQGFRPDSFYYKYDLPVGTIAYPRLGYEPADDWQTVELITADSTESTYVRQLIVTSESQKSHTYTVAYTILKSDVDTLQDILVNGQQLPDFDAHKEEYEVLLTAAQATELNGSVPDVLYVEGDEYQTVFVSQAPDSLIGKKSLGLKSLINVKAATGVSRTYTIHYPVELSDETTLNMIMLGGKPLDGYVAERFSYKWEIEKDAAIPVVSVVKKEEAQTYEIYVLVDTVQVYVTAEDTTKHSTYTLTFERLLSANTTLRDIILRDASGEQLPSAQFPFRPDVYEYSAINLQFEADKTLEQQLPSIEIVFSDSLQTSETVQHELPNGDIRIDITVTAPNGEDQAVYSLTFHFVKPSIALLKDILLGEQSIPDFDPFVTEYTYRHPYGTNPEDLFTVDSVTYVLADSLASATVSADSTTLIITVIAQDGTTENSYFIRQEIGKDSNNDLQWITVGGDSLPDFDPDVTFYTYLLSNGAAVPIVDAAPASENAEILDISTVAAGDTCVIICQAADESMKRYYIHFAVSPINEGQTAGSTDVLVKRIPGTYQIVVATLRKDVSFAMYDQSGHVVYTTNVPVANPNDVDVHQDANGQDVLNDVGSSAGIVINVIPRQVYFYSFFVSGGTKSVNRGKFICF